MAKQIKKWVVDRENPYGHYVIYSSDGETCDQCDGELNFFVRDRKWGRMWLAECKNCGWECETQPTRYIREYKFNKARRADANEVHDGFFPRGD